MLFTMVIGMVALKTGYAPLFVAMALFDLIGSAFLCGLLSEPKRGPASQ
jgi:hypothetical protein